MFKTSVIRVSWAYHTTMDASFPGWRPGATLRVGSQVPLYRPPVRNQHRRRGYRPAGIDRR